LRAQRRGELGAGRRELREDMNESSTEKLCEAAVVDDLVRRELDKSRY
jgi:hypothetical protein